jgi:hypothetical protein
MTWRCPWCDNTDEATIQDNGERPTSRDLTLLCVARVKPEMRRFNDPPMAEDLDADGLVACGEQWAPNEDKPRRCPVCQDSDCETKSSRCGR